MNSDELARAIAGLTLLEAADLAARLRDALGVDLPIRAPRDRDVDASTSDPPPPRLEEFSIELVSAGDKRVHVIRALREVGSFGLAEARALLDATPAVVARGLDRAAAEAWRRALADAGARVEVRAAT